jgi:lysophospholipase L1-like esterase
VIAFNDVLDRQARAHGAEVVDLYGPSRAEVPRRPELIAADRYHPSDAGYARWAELMWAGIDARIRR